MVQVTDPSNGNYIRTGLRIPTAMTSGLVIPLNPVDLLAEGAVGQLFTEQGPVRATAIVVSGEVTAGVILADAAWGRDFPVRAQGRGIFVKRGRNQTGSAIFFSFQN